MINTLNTEITVDQIKSAVSKLQEYKCTPLVIRTDSEAKQFTDNDILERVWHKGDKYYTAYTNTGPLFHYLSEDRGRKWKATDTKEMNNPDSWVDYE